MEVHHHAHPSTVSGHRKKWTHYFWEFLMLFLAVFCGFLAEYKLEHTIEHQRGKKYINTLAKDVELDIASLHETSVIKRKYVNYFDSLVYLLKQNNNSSLKDIYFYARHLGRITEFKYHDRTIQQLKNSGSLRLIRNKDAADSITIYDSQDIKLILNQQEIERQMRSDILSNQIGKIFNGYIWNDMVDSKGVISRTSGNPELATRN